MPPTFNGQTLSFTDQTRDAFWAARGHDAQTFLAPPTNTLTQYWLCGTCGQMTLYAGAHMGHIVEWAQHLRDNGIDEHSSFDDAQAWYNDFNNLMLQCATCNQGHEWEFRNYQGEADDYSDADSQDNLMGFVVYPCPTCAGEDVTTEEAMDGTQAYVCLNAACGHRWAATA